jgi:tetratricopeptide (TPR) repeat protein
MSLINDMLKDLERRPQAKALEPSEILADLKWGVSHELKLNKNYYFIIAGLIIILLLAISLLFLKARNHAAHTAFHAQKQILPASKTPLARENEALFKTQTQPAILTGIALQVQQNSTALRFLLNQNTFYRVSSDVHRNEFIIIFEKTHLLAALPKMNYIGSGIENIRAYIDEKGNLKLILQLADDVEIKRLELNEEGKAPELQVDLFFKNNPVTAVAGAQKNMTIPVIIKKPVAENSAEQEFQQATNSYQMGQIHNAMQMLASILVTFPQYNQAREKLAALYLETGNITAAKYLVNTGLKRQPDYLPFTELKARILMQSGNIAAAIELLENSAPPLTKNPEYHAFIAALYQRSGKAKLAANLYKQLINLQPNNGKWWLGLGVALDALGSHEQALEAFANADNAGGLNPELKAYVSTQLRNA